MVGPFLDFLFFLFLLNAYFEISLFSFYWNLAMVFLLGTTLMAFHYIFTCIV